MDDSDASDKSPATGSLKRLPVCPYEMYLFSEIYHSVPSLNAAESQMLATGATSCCLCYKGIHSLGTNWHLLSYPAAADFEKLSVAGLPCVISLTTSQHGNTLK